MICYILYIIRVIDIELFFGKNTILKTLGLSQIIFSAKNTTMPDNAIDDITQIVYTFLWHNQERIQRKVLNSKKQANEG